MKKIIKTLLVVMIIAMVVMAFAACKKDEAPETPADPCANGHTLVAYGEDPATCTEDGLSSGVICSVCGYVERTRFPIPAKGHKMADATCEEPSTCTVCGHTEGEALGHSMVEAEKLDPTCTTVGYTAHMACERCNYTEGKAEIEMLPHSFTVEVEALAPTCEEPGYTAHKLCDVCGAKDESYESLPKLGHDFNEDELFVAVAPTCTEEGLLGGYCVNCGKGFYVGYIPATEHALEDVEGKAPTCTEDGYTAHKSCACGQNVEGYEVLPALGHRLENWIAKPATCTEAGYSAHQRCSREGCDYATFYVESAPKGHSYEAVVTAPTCTKAGYTTYTCACGDTYTEAGEAALGHNYVNGTCDVCNTKVIYFVNVEKWTKVNAYMWDSTNNGWPGVAMTKTGEQVHGFDVYKVEYTAAYVNVIFNNGSAQTADLVISKGHYFCPLNSIWYESASDVPSFEGITKTSYYLPGAFNSWKDANVFLKEGTSTVIRSYVSLQANQTYEFKVKTGNTWYGSTGTVSATSTTITFSTTGTNAKIKTACAGVYIFEYNTSTKKLTVIYPHVEETLEAVAPTCTTTGLTEGKKCSVCGTTIVKQTTIPMVEHAWDDAEAIIRTCTVCGLVENTHFAGGQGTAEDPYLIKTAAQLANISEYYGTYQYYKVADGVATIDMTGVGKISLHGSFDGNNVKLVNLTTALFEYVGYNNGVEEIKISNVDVTMNNLDGRAFVRNIFNGGKTTFENVALHGYIEGLYNMGSFYNYGTANLGGSEGADYTVEFLNSTSDVTLVCTSGNVAGGFLGHAFEGAGHSFTMILTNSSFTGKILTTNGKGNLYFAMTSDYNNTLNKFIVDGEEVHFNNGQIPAAANLGKISVVLPTVGENGYTVAPVEGATNFVVYLNAQVSAHNEDGTYVVNHNGMTWPLGNFDLETLAGYGLITKAVIVNGVDHEFGYEIVDGVLTIYSGRTSNYCSGTVRLQANQYDAEGNLLATGTISVYVIEHPHTFVGQTCTTAGKCGCGATVAALGHDYDHITHDATCTKGAYVEHICAICDDTYTDGETEALGHADENGDYKCDRCSTKVLPADGSTITVAQAIAIGNLFEHGTYTTQKYYITGIIASVPDATYGNFDLTDGNGNTILIYGLYSADGKTQYGSMADKPKKGDEITVYTVLGKYSNAPQGKNAWMDDFVKHTEHVWVDASCTAPKTCALCDLTEGEALEHTYVDGECTGCGKVEGAAALVNANLSFSSKNNRTQFTTSIQVWEQNGVKVTNNKASSSSNVADYAGPARFYAGSNIVVEGVGISKIVFDCNSSSYATALKNSIGTVSGATVTVSSDKVTVTFSAPVDSFTIAKLTAQVRMDSITIN